LAEQVSVCLLEMLYFKIRASKRNDNLDCFEWKCVAMKTKFNESLRETKECHPKTNLPNQ
jgi:hypothetical protein